MNTLSLTDEGKLCAGDYRSIHKAIVVILAPSPRTMLGLVLEVRKTHHEFKYLQDGIIAKAIYDLISSGMVRSTYA